MSASDRGPEELGADRFLHHRVDSIDWAREEIETTNKLLAEGHEILIGPGAQEKVCPYAFLLGDFN